ncbi:MAG: trypsin-like peptidase domain-containing protein [Pirellulaceae bacterium]
MSNSHQKTFSQSRGAISRFRCWLAARMWVFALGAALLPQVSVAQDEALLDPTIQGQGRDVVQVAPPRTSLKPVSPARSRAGEGETYVALAQGLRDVFAGKEPSTLQELRLLEVQQSLVAKAIEQVTVNVQQGAAQGSGVIITPDGYVLTAAHVAGGADRDAYLLLNDGTRVKARTLGMNRSKDAGLMKIVDQRDGPWPHATLGRSSDLKVGQWCIASGHPGGWRPERGAVIRVGRVLSISKSPGEDEANTLFTDCALIGGDSGGPLFTLEGKLIGIHSRIGTDVVDNMHVPIDVYASSWDRMAAKEVWGMLPGFQPIIGVSGGKTNDAPTIVGVAPNGPAERAGIMAGDTVLSVDGVSITTFAELQMAVQATMPGDVIVLKIKRDQQILRIPVTVGVQDGQ